MMENKKEDYIRLLAKFPENHQGLSREVGLAQKTHQSMTYALVLSSEVFHFKANPNKESRRRIQNAVNWLIRKADADNDELVGWGLPQSWDAFSDGSINKENHPYTITSALVIQSLLDALRLPNFWKKEEESMMRDVMEKATVRWCTDLWTGRPWGGYFWYSPAAEDAHFVPNVSAMFLGVLARYLNEQGIYIKEEILSLANSKIDTAAQAVDKMVKWKQKRPSWDYIAEAISYVKNRANDLVHHCYILWGMELYRKYRGQVNLSWPLSKSISSLDLFWRNEVLCDFPLTDSEHKKQTVHRDRPANLWGAGMMLAFYASYASREKIQMCFDSIKHNYGPFERLRLFPDRFSDDETFYHRYAAHVLYGLAIYLQREKCF